VEPSSITLRHQPAERYHLVGICGAGLKALAEYLCDQGHCVAGSDTGGDTRTANCLGQLGVTVLSGHRKEHLCPEATCVVHSAAVPPDCPELEAARVRGIPVVSYPQFLAELTRSRETIGVAGTHGKSTTTAILGTLLRGLGGKPDLLCGAESIDTGRNGSAGDGSRLVLECCEFRRHFLGLTIQSLLVTGI
jgi:UDP-N-acetylmuramate--alanine ligase